MQLSPARGRLRLLLEAAMQVSLMQLSPARGWLHYVEQHIFIDDDAAQPREGTVTLSQLCSCETFLIQLIPARGHPPCPLVLSGIFRLFLDIPDELCYS